MRVAGGGKRGQAVHSEVIEMPSHGCRGELTYHALWEARRDFLVNLDTSQLTGRFSPRRRGPGPGILADAAQDGAGFAAVATPSAGLTYTRPPPLRR